jgi:hypothetical protein
VGTPTISVKRPLRISSPRRSTRWRTVLPVPSPSAIPLSTDLRASAAAARLSSSAFNRDDPSRLEVTFERDLVDASIYPRPTRSASSTNTKHGWGPHDVSDSLGSQSLNLGSDIKKLGVDRLECSTTRYKTRLYRRLPIEDVKNVFFKDRVLRSEYLQA